MSDGIVPRLRPFKFQSDSWEKKRERSDDCDDCAGIPR
jgi:hypothetical protein